MPIQHACSLSKKSDSAELFGTSGYHCRKLRTVFLISSNNPLNSEFFRSERSLKAEKKRQIDLHKLWVIHPLSTFRVWYDCYMIFVYIANLIGKPIDAAFAKSQAELFKHYRLVSVTLDLLCWIDIFVNFNTGFAVKKTNQIELRRKLIAKNYIQSPYFVCDFLSSIPRNLPYFIHQKPKKIWLGLINIIGLLKFARIFTVVTLINRMSKFGYVYMGNYNMIYEEGTAHIIWIEFPEFFQVRSTGLRFLVNSVLVTYLLIHWLSCMQFIVPRLTGRYFHDPDNPFEKSWIYRNGIYHKSLTTKYMHCFFKASAEMLGMQLDMYPMEITSDYIVSICSYWIGKIIISAIWIILTVAMLNARSMELKFLEIINQLDAYMKQKQLPLNLREKIAKYYDFRFQRIFFKENMITNMLCPNLKREVNIHVCKSMIASVNLFAELTPDQIKRLVSKLIPEIFLPKDTILQSGMFSDSMYFLSSGTVAVYSHSGREICHLQEGAYFGEICMVFKNQLTITTIVAVESTQVYRLRRKNFEECLMNNKKVMTKMVTEAEKWRKIVLGVEEDYKKRLFQQSYATWVQNTGGNRRNFESIASMDETHV